MVARLGTSPVIGHNPSYTSKRGGSSSPGHVANLDIHQRAPPTASASRVSECSAVLRACLSMTAHHALRRAVMSTRYVQTLSAALSLVGELMKMPNRGSDDVVSIAEQAVLLALESVAQVPSLLDACRYHFYFILYTFCIWLEICVMSNI